MKVKNAIKKVGAAAASTLMVGMTMGSAATLADYPGMFLDDDGTPTANIVVGTGGAVTDVVSAVNVAASLGQATVQTGSETRTVDVQSGGSGWSVSDGAGATLSTENTQLYFGEGFDKSGLTSTLTQSDFDLLESGEVSNVDGENYGYDQYVAVGDKSTGLAVPEDADDATLLVDAGTDATSPLYTSQITFNKPLNASLAAEEDADITLFGTDYTFSDESMVGDGGLVLFGGQDAATISEAESQTLTVDGNDIELEVDSVTSGPSANVVINGDLENNVAEGDTFNIDGIDEEVRVDTIVYRGDLNYGQRGRVVFSVGSEKLVLEDGEPVLVGSNEEDVEGTEVTINGGGPSPGDEVSKLEVGVAAEDDESADIEAGTKMMDPVFDTFGFYFGGVNPEQMAESRSTIEVNGGSDVGTVDVVNSDGDSATLNVWETENTNDANGDLYSDDYDWALFEGANMTEDDYTIVDSGDFTHVLELTDVEGTDAEDQVEFEDAHTGASYTVTTGDDGEGEMYIDGQQYYVRTDGTDVQVTWGTGSGYGNVGAQLTVFPAFEEENGAMTAISDQVTINDVDNSGALTIPDTAVLELPTGTSNANWSALADGATTDTIDVGELTWAYDGSTANQLVFNSDDVATDAAGFHVVEEEADSDGSPQHVITFTTTENDDEEFEVDTPDFSSNAGAQEGELDNDDSIWMDTFGTFVEYDDDDMEEAVVHYPDNQASMGVGVVDEDGTLSSSGGSGSQDVTVDNVVTNSDMVGTMSDIAMTDEQVSQSDRDSDMILVGGPAVNTLVGELAADGQTWTEDQWSENHQDQALLQLVEGAFGDGNHALIVAGWGAEDTSAAARYLSNYGEHQDALEDADDSGRTLTLTSSMYPGQ